MEVQTIARQFDEDGFAVVRQLFSPMLSANTLWSFVREFSPLKAWTPC